MSGVVAYINQLKERQGIDAPDGLPHQDRSVLVDVEVLDALARTALATRRWIEFEAEHANDREEPEREAVDLAEALWDELIAADAELSRVVDQQSRT